MRRAFWLALLVIFLAPASARADSLLSETAGDFFSPRNYRVGELVTLRISESVQVVESVDMSSRNDLAMEAGVTGALSTLATSLISANGTIDALGVGANVNKRNADAATTLNSVSHVLTARVVAVEGDVLTLEASKHTVMDGIKRNITLQGKVRRQDIAEGNYVESGRMADMQFFADGLKISPTTKGLLGWFLGLFR